MKVGDKVWVRPEAGSTGWRRGEILRSASAFRAANDIEFDIEADDFEVRVTTGHYEDVTWFYPTELRPRGAVDRLAELVP